VASIVTNGVSVRHLVTVSPNAQSKLRHGSLARYRGTTVGVYSGDVHRRKVWQRHRDDEEEHKSGKEEEDPRDTESA